jgi:phosphinothricin acetyltransferase
MTRIGPDRHDRVVARIRPATLDDAAAIQAIYAPVVRDSAISFETAPPSARDMAARMTGPSGGRKLPWLVAERDGCVIGYAYAARHRERGAYRWSVDTSIYVADAAHGRGVGRALYQRLLPTLGGLNYASAYAGIALPNPASVGLHEAVGFRPIGVFPRVGYKHGRWHDVGWWWLPLATSDEPAEPEPWVPDGSPGGPS